MLWFIFIVSLPFELSHFCFYFDVLSGEIEPTDRHVCGASAHAFQPLQITRTASHRAGTRTSAVAFD